MQNQAMQNFVSTVASADFSGLGSGSDYTVSGDGLDLTDTRYQSPRY